MRMYTVKRCLCVATLQRPSAFRPVSFSTGPCSSCQRPTESTATDVLRSLAAAVAVDIGGVVRSTGGSTARVMGRGGAEGQRVKQKEPSARHANSQPARRHMALFDSCREPWVFLARPSSEPLASAHV